VQVLSQWRAGIDVHKDQVTMAVRLPGQGPGGRETRVCKFGAFGLRCLGSSLGRGISTGDA
jgi:hypothetical protein